MTDYSRLTKRLKEKSGRQCRKTPGLQIAAFKGLSRDKVRRIDGGYLVVTSIIVTDIFTSDEEMMLGNCAFSLAAAALA